MISGLPGEIGIDLMGVLSYPDFKSPNNGCQILGLGAELVFGVAQFRTFR